MSKVVAIIQARMGSTRLPGKVLKELGGETVLAQVISRIRNCRHLSELIVATSVDPADDVIVQECNRLGARVFRGDQHDVLDRYYQATREVGAEVIVRITADCPLIDPTVSDQTIAAFLQAAPDYASNVLQRTFPRGLDTEVMTTDALQHAWSEARSPHEREHVTPFLYEHPGHFRLLSVVADADYSDHRWTLDTPEDLEFLRAVYARRVEGQSLGWRQVLSILASEPELISINRDIRQKAT